MKFFYNFTIILIILISSVCVLAADHKAEDEGADEAEKDKRHYTVKLSAAKAFKKNTRPMFSI
jgi:hypothetical protein